MDLIKSDTIHFAQGSEFPLKEKDDILRVYSMRLCPYAERARIILLAKKLPHEIVNIDLKRKPDWYLKLNSQGKVPALDIGSKIIPESLDVCDYLEDTYPEPRLYPNDSQAKARDKQLIKKFDDIITLYYEVVRNPEKKPLSSFATSIGALLKEYEKELSIRGNFFGGNEPGMVDYMVWPWAERVEVIDLIYGQKLPVPEDEIVHIRQWCNNMRKLDLIKGISISSERHHNIMKLYVSGDPVDYDSL